MIWLCYVVLLGVGRYVIRFLRTLGRRGFPARGLPRYGRRVPPGPAPSFPRTPPKPPWVRTEVIRLKALMPQTGCRTIAQVFNRRCAVNKQMTVGKTFVSQVIRAHRYEIQVTRKNIKHAKPRLVPRNLIWAMDLTGKTDTEGKTHALLGIVEHHSRANLTLRALKDKTAITLLRCLLDAIECYGQPKLLRTDNEAVFTSLLFRVALWLLGIRHQRTDRHCPWQNGRVERFFGTLKEKLDLWEVGSLQQLNGALAQFQFWYHHVRPHQNLNGRTPAEVWNGIDIYTKRPQREYWFEAWDGLLTGIYLRL
jgi:transposase InsO family protein